MSNDSTCSRVSGIFFATIWKCPTLNRCQYPKLTQAIFPRLPCKHSDEHGDRLGRGNSRSVRFHIFLWTASHLHCFLIMVKKYFFLFPNLFDYCLRADRLLTWSSIITLEPNFFFFFTVFLAWGHRKEKSILFNRKSLNQASTYWNTHKLKESSLRQRWTSCQMWHDYH